MNISLQNIDKLNAEITVVIEPADYTEKYTKAVKDAKKRVNMPGFRPGMVPTGLIKKQFGPGILADEVNRLLQDKLFSYIQENKVNMLGSPLPQAANNEVKLAEGESFTFKFDLAIAPEFDATLTKQDKIAYYNVEVTDQMVENQLDMYRQRGGKYDKVDSYEDGDMVKGVLTELDVDTPVTAEGAVMLPRYFKNDDQKKLFEGAKTNDVIRFNPATAYDNNEAELASLLKVDKADALNHKGDFQIQITEMTRFVPGELTQDLFDSVFPGGEVKDEADFRGRIKASIAAQFAKDSDYRFILDVKKYEAEKLGKLEFPDEKLKKIMLANADGDQEKVDRNYDKSIEELTWHLVKEQLVAQNEVKVNDDDVKDMAREVTRMQFAQYGMMNLPDEYLENSVKEMLKKRETVDNLIDRCIEVKLAAALKQQVTLDEQTISAEDFNKLFENAN